MREGLAWTCNKRGPVISVGLLNPTLSSLVEERVSKSDSEVGSNIDMAELRFKHLKKMVLEKSKDMGLDVKQ